jgi:gamma-glutamyltranspeptidase
MGIHARQLVLVLALLALPAAAAPMRPTHAAQAMVSSAHAEASRAGVEIMRAGGNAVDAAVAVGFALAVVHPQAGNLGGGGFLLLRTVQGGEHFLDFREKAVAKATPNMFLDAHGNAIADASLYGYKAVGVPGSVAGLAMAQKKWGKFPLAQVMAPAIQLASAASLGKKRACSPSCSSAVAASRRTARRTFSPRTSSPCSLASLRGGNSRTSRSMSPHAVAITGARRVGLEHDIGKPLVA